MPAFAGSIRETGATRKVFDTISDNAANAGLVLGGNRVRPDAVDLQLGGGASAPQWCDRGFRRRRGRAGPSRAGRGLARQQAVALGRNASQPGEIILSGSFTAPVFASPGDRFDVDYAYTRHYFREVRMNRLKAALAQGTTCNSGSGNPWPTPTRRRSAPRGLRLASVRWRTCPQHRHRLLAQLQAVAAYPVEAVARPPIGDPVLIKQYLDIGFRSLLIPMVGSVQQAELLVSATRYPPAGIRGVAGHDPGVGLWRDAGLPDQGA